MITAFQELPPLSLYVHIPWCVRKCPYCDFNSHQADDQLNENAYVSALMHDLDSETSCIGERKIESIFFGGGTPSLFSAESIDRLLRGIQDRLNLDANAEITLEANPGTFEQNKFSEFRAAGINRLSIGIQSFDDACLQQLGRVHDGAQAQTAIATAFRAGFDNINLDLMFGLPAQTITQAVNDVRIASNYQPQHISHYQLTIEPNTFFYKHPPRLPGTEALWEAQHQCQQLLSDHGYIQYEVSAFSKPSKQCQHNINYWSFGDYIGIGAGAHGKLTNLDTGQIIRRWKRRQPQDYVEQVAKGNAASGESRLEKKDIVFEFLLNALRLRQGCSLSTFEKHTGLNKSELIQSCASIDAELLIIDDDQIRTSEMGYRFLNDVLEKLL